MANIMNNIKKINWWLLAICVISVVALGMLGGLLGGSTKGYDSLNGSNLTPPAIVFPIVWTILYILLGISLYLIISFQPTNDVQARLKTLAIILFGAQMLLNITWTLIFFRLDLYILAFVWIVLMLSLTVTLMLITLSFSRPAALLLIPYILWLAFAAYLNLIVAINN